MKRAFHFWSAPQVRPNMKNIDVTGKSANGIVPCVAHIRAIAVPIKTQKLLLYL